MDGLFTDTPIIENSSTEEPGTYTEGAEILAPDTEAIQPLFEDTGENPPSEPASDSTSPDAPEEQSALIEVTEENLSPTPMPCTADIEPIITQTAQLQETVSSIQADIQFQTRQETDYFRYSFIVFVMIFCALLVHLLFSKIQV